jgi:predicted Zn-dependent protease
MAKAGHDPTAIGRFFKLLEEKLGDHGGTSMLSTHPGTPERRKAIEDYAKEVLKQQ